MYKHSDLDKRICDIEEGATNTETLREFIKRSEKYFDMVPKNLDSINEEKLNEYIDFLDYLWDK
ncbi:hypothetical protein [Clostridium perfringens]|uniref:Uncharacterized protein n=1 Tax=Clostridium perfringens TaxID=1502 RepID=A0ABD4PU14_CLOPF|nr:hypothetical protein [Clostridium perfringens]MBO3417966.1 hypothetical protein [Clostridium perfringens]